MYMNSKFFLFPFIYLLACIPAVAAESWVALPNANSNILFSVDENSLTRKNDVVRFKERLVYIRPEVTDTSSGKKIKEKLVHRVMNCKNRTQAYMSASLIGENGKRLEEIFLNEDKLVMVPIPKGSLADIELEWACK